MNKVANNDWKCKLIEFNEWTLLYCIYSYSKCTDTLVVVSCSVSMTHWVGTNQIEKKTKFLLPAAVACSVACALWPVLRPVAVTAAACALRPMLRPMLPPCGQCCRLSVAIIIRLLLRRGSWRIWVLCCTMTIEWGVWGPIKFKPHCCIRLQWSSGNDIVMTSDCKW